MKILVTGATGFVGNVLIPMLYAHPEVEAVSALILPGENPPHGWKDRPVRIIVGDIRDPQAVNAAVAGHSHVIHMAGLISYWRRELPQLFAVNRDGVRHVVDACLENGVTRLVHISSVGAVGFHPDGTLADETTPFNWPEQLPYMVSKHDGQRVVEEAVAQRGLPAVIINPASIMGPGDPNPNTPHNQLYRNIYNGPMLGCFAGGLAVVDVRDLCQLIVAALQGDQPGQAYLAIGANLTYREVVQTIARAAQRKAYPFALPGWIFFVAGLFMEALAAITRKRPLLTAAYGRLSAWRAYYSNHKSVQAFGIAYRPFAQTVADTCRYYESHFLKTPAH
jgi:dihydroflavonol-4-reductase